MTWRYVGRPLVRLHRVSDATRPAVAVVEVGAVSQASSPRSETVEVTYVDTWRVQPSPSIRRSLNHASMLPVGHGPVEVTHIFIRSQAPSSGADVAQS